MRLSTQLYWDKLLVPNNYPEIPTSQLLENGTFCFFRDPGAPFYLPIGQRVVQQLEAVISHVAESLGLQHISIPIVTRDEVMRQGHEIAPGFAAQIMHLAPPMNGYHLMFTPEPVIHDLAKLSLLSFRQLPLRFCYHLDVFRAVGDLKGILKSREFKTFVGTSVEPDIGSVAATISLFEQLTRDVLTLVRVRTRDVRRKEGIVWETFYMGSEGESLHLPELEVAQPILGLSLAMAYRYGAETKLGARFQDAENRKCSVLMTTYGLGVQRLLFAVFDSCRDRWGFALPPCIRPFDVSVIPSDRRAAEHAENVYVELRKQAWPAVLDDRLQYSSGRRAAFSDYLGIPVKLTICDGECKVQLRGTEVPVRTGSTPDVLAFVNDHRRDLVARDN